MSMMMIQNCESWIYEFMSVTLLSYYHSLRNSIPAIPWPWCPKKAPSKHCWSLVGCQLLFWALCITVLPLSLCTCDQGLLDRWHTCTLFMKTKPKPSIILKFVSIDMLWLFASDSAISEQLTDSDSDAHDIASSWRLKSNEMANSLETWDLGFGPWERIMGHRSNRSSDLLSF